MNFLRQLVSVIRSIPIIVFGLAYVLLWIVPRDFYRGRNRKKQYQESVNASAQAPLKSIIDQVERESSLPYPSGQKDIKHNEWGGA